MPGIGCREEGPGLEVKAVMVDGWCEEVRCLKYSVDNENKPRMWWWMMLFIRQNSELGLHCLSCHSFFVSTCEPWNRFTLTSSSQSHCRISPSIYQYKYSSPQMTKASSTDWQRFALDMEHPLASVHSCFGPKVLEHRRLCVSGMIRRCRTGRCQVCISHFMPERLRKNSESAGSRKAL